METQTARNKKEQDKMGKIEKTSMTGKGVGRINIMYGLTLTLNLDVIMHFIDYLHLPKGSALNTAKGK